MPEASRPLKGAIIGYGLVASEGHVPVYIQRARTRKDVEIVAIADVCVERRALAAESLPFARIYTDYEILLEQEADSLDFVDVATPTFEHAAIAQASLERKVHVLCETPLTILPEDARGLLETAAQSQRVLFPCNGYKQAPIVKAVREILLAGTIGRVHAVTFNDFRHAHAEGVPEWRTHWRREKHYSGGGVAMNLASHAFYLTFEWMGSYPTAISAKTANLHPDRFDSEDDFSAMLTFPTGLADIRLSWTAGVRKVLFSIQGERGAITVNDDEMQVAVMQGAGGARSWSVDRKTVASGWTDENHVQWFDALFDRFRATIAAGDISNREAREASFSIGLIEAAYWSAAERSQELPVTPLK